MKITITKGIKNPEYEAHEWQEMAIDGKDELSVYPLCEYPEDAIIGRDLIPCTKIAELMRRAFHAGANGEDFSVEEVEGCEEDEE